MVGVNLQLYIVITALQLAPLALAVFAAARVLGWPKLRSALAGAAVYALALVSIAGSELWALL